MSKGAVTPVPHGIDFVQDGELKTSMYKILATASIDEYGVVVLKDFNKQWYVYRIEKNSDESLRYTYVFSASDAVTEKDRFSILMSRELEDVVKVYIAHDEGISQFNILDTDYTT